MKTIIAERKHSKSITAFDSTIPFRTDLTGIFRMSGMVGFSSGPIGPLKGPINFVVYGSDGSTIMSATTTENISSIYFEMTASMSGSNLKCDGFFIRSSSYELTSPSAGMIAFSTTITLGSLGEYAFNFSASTQEYELELFYAKQEIA